jgi:hypothetical protein
MSTFTDDDTTDAQTTDRELADDTDASLGELARMVEFNDEDAMQTPFGPMTEAELIDMIRPILHDWVRTNPEQAEQLLSILHLATGDLIEEHADRNAEEIAGELTE